MSEKMREALAIAQELRHAEGLAAPHPRVQGKESSLHREGLLLDAARTIEALSQPSVGDVLRKFKAYVESTPLGSEDNQLGKSYYNWGKHYLDVLQGIVGVDIGNSPSPTKDCEECGAPCMDWQPCAKCWERIANRTPEEKEASLRALGIFPPSPSYTREELVELFMSHIYRYAGDRQQLKWDVTKALDALIALGAVRVK